MLRVNNSFCGGMQAIAILIRVGNISYSPNTYNGTEWPVSRYDSIATVGEIRVWWRADFQSGSRVLQKVF